MMWLAADHNGGFGCKIQTMVSTGKRERLVVLGRSLLLLFDIRRCRKIREKLCYKKLCCFSCREAGEHGNGNPKILFRLKSYRRVVSH